RDDDELRAVGVPAQQLDEAAGVGVVERGLAFVEQVERARTGEEEREQGRDPAEGLLAAREQREPRHALAPRPELDLDAWLLAVLAIGQAQAAFAAREERGGDLGEVRADRREGLVEAALDRLGQLRAQLLQLVEARFEVGAR